MKFILSALVVIISSVSQAQLKPMTLAEAKQFLSLPMPLEIEQALEQTPREYSFFNSDGSNTVNYMGQVMRQVLIHDAKLVFGSMRRGQFTGQLNTAYGKLNSYYRYNSETDGFKPFLVTAKDINGGTLSLYEGTVYADVFPRKINLESKMAGNDNSLRHGKLLGWNSAELEGVSVDFNQDGTFTPTELFEAMMQVIANNAASNEIVFSAENGSLPAQEIREAHITESGLDLAQMAQKLLHAAVSFSQAAGDYMSVDLVEKKKGLLADNKTLLQRKDKDGNILIDLPYTTLQHHWDEAFGYFGAARNYFDYTDKQIRKGISIDIYEALDVEDSTGAVAYVDQSYNNPDFEISLMSEKNLGMSLNAAKRDLSAKLGNEDFTQNIMSAMLKGRQLIQESPKGYLKYAQAYSVLAINEWERVLAATTVHYINYVIADYEKYGTDAYSFVKLAKHFGEMKGFAFAFQFNPVSEMKTSDFITMHQLMGDFPVKPSSGDVANYKEKLIKARDIIAESFSFDSENAEVW